MSDQNQIKPFENLNLIYLLNDINIFNGEIETCSVEIVNSKSRNFIVTSIYRLPIRDIKVFKNYWKDFLKKKGASSKTVFMVGDININSFDYDHNEKKFQSDFSKWILASYTEGNQSNK